MPHDGSEDRVLACRRRARWRPDIRGAAVLRLSLRASHQSIRCRNAGRRLESALEDVLIDKFGARRAKRRARVRKAARSHLPTAGAHATAVRLKLVPSHQAWDRPHLSSTRVRGLRVWPSRERSASGAAKPATSAYLGNKGRGPYDKSPGAAGSGQQRNNPQPRALHLSPGKVPSCQVPHISASKPTSASACP